MAELMSVTWSWKPGGQLTIIDGTLAFPRASDIPAVYRFTFVDGAGVRTGVYVGETDRLWRRFQGYRTPGPSQQTNLRVNAIMIDTLGQGGHIDVEITTQAQSAGGDGTYRPLDLSWKAARVLIERAVEVAERTAGSPLINADD